MLEKLLPLPLLLLLDRGARGFGDQEIVVAALVGKETAARQLDDARGDAVEEIAVVRDEETRAGVAREKVLQPLDGLRIEMVRGFVEDEKVRPRDQRAAQRDAPFFSTAQRRDRAVALRRVEMRSQTFDAAVEIPAVEVVDLIEQHGAARMLGRGAFILRQQREDVCRACFDIRENRGLLLQRESLRQPARHQITPAREHARVRLQLARRDPQECGLAAAVATHEPDAFAFLHRHGGAVEHGVRTVADGQFGGAGNGIGHKRAVNIHVACGRGKLESG